LGALNSVLPDPEPTPAEAVPGVALEPTPETVEGRPAKTCPQRWPKARQMSPRLLRRVLKVPQRWRRKQRRKQRRSERRRLPQC
jgi:hypothetical protein